MSRKYFRMKSYLRPETFKDVVFKPWGPQRQILHDTNRQLGIFAGKRCITPDSTVLTPDGRKQFGDIRESESILSFHQTANQFRFSQTLGAFPKTKEIGARVIHEHGEFRASFGHQLLCADGAFQSIAELKARLDMGCLIPLATGPIFSMSRLISIEKDAEETWFWDIEVPGDNNYVANGAIHHNSGKTEIGAIKSILYQENKPNIQNNGHDPYLGVIIAPTFDMLRRLSMRKFMLYAEPMIRSFNKSTNEILWNDDSLVYGLSAEKPQRIEGLKANWIWLDEVFQMSEHLYLECRARLADTKGYLIATGSLGTNIINPRLHWAHRYFKQNPDEQTSCYEWMTKDNPHFPADELDLLKSKLDPQDFRSMFEIHWDTMPKAAVYHNFTDDNIVHNYVYNPQLPTYVSIDWGWAHPMAALFFQVDWKRRTVYLFDEIVASQMTIEKLHAQIMNKPYNYGGWCCDIAGNQEREQSGKSNIQWFAERNIHFRQRRTAINYGIPIVRSFILNGRAERKLYVSANCVRSIDGIKQYRYPEKDGQITNETPIKKDDDVVDALRYFIVNYMDEALSSGPSMAMLT